MEEAAVLEQTESPLSLQDDTEIGHEPEPEEVKPIEAPPGNVKSEYRKCSCLGVMPGRVCPMCNGSKWLKECPNCKGEGRVYSQRGGRVARSEGCGWCRGNGYVGAPKGEVDDLLKDAPPVVLEPEQSEEPFRRAVRLPNPKAKKKARRKRGGPRIGRAVREERQSSGAESAT